MKKDVFIVGDYLVSPLGTGSDHHFNQLLAGSSAITRFEDRELSDTPISAGRIGHFPDLPPFVDCSRYTRLECLFILAMHALIEKYDIPNNETTIVVLSTTKGNIGLLSRPIAPFPPERAFLPAMAEALQAHFRLANPIVVVSNACISGSLALSVARQILTGGNRYTQAIVIGGDELSAFIVSGFKAFQALDDGPCRPFDRNRKGLNLGEAVAAVYLTKTPAPDAVRIVGVGSCNDANHISGPSRTGEGLFRSIQAALRETAGQPIDFISAHGTATPYNDEMEAIALDRAGLTDVPVHSLKGYFGHTLGASGLLETVMAIHSLRHNRLLPSKGYENPGTSISLNIIREVQEKPLNTFLKTASGFGGCNIATIFEKI